MMKFQWQLLAHGVNLLEELIVFTRANINSEWEWRFLVRGRAMILILSLFGYESLFYLRLALLESIFCSYAEFVGGVAEWLNAPVLKTDVGESLPWVRIPPPPP